MLTFPNIFGIIILSTNQIKGEKNNMELNTINEIVNKTVKVISNDIKNHHAQKRGSDTGMSALEMLRVSIRMSADWLKSMTGVDWSQLTIDEFNFVTETIYTKLRKNSIIRMAKEY